MRLFSNVGYDWRQLREGLHASTTHVDCGYSSDYVCALQSRSLHINACSAHLTADTAVSTRFAGNLLRSWFLSYRFGSWIAKLAVTSHLEHYGYDLLTNRSFDTYYNHLQCLYVTDIPTNSSRD